MPNRSWLLVVRAAGLDSTVHYVRSLECTHTRTHMRVHTHTSCRLVRYCREVSIVRREDFFFVVAKRISIQKLENSVFAINVIYDRANTSTERPRDIIITHKRFLSDHRREWRHSPQVYFQAGRKSRSDAMDRFLQGNYAFSSERVNLSTHYTKIEIRINDI